MPHTLKWRRPGEPSAEQGAPPSALPGVISLWGSTLKKTELISSRIKWHFQKKYIESVSFTFLLKMDQGGILGGGEERLSQSLGTLTEKVFFLPHKHEHFFTQIAVNLYGTPCQRMW